MSGVVCYIWLFTLLFFWHNRKVVFSSESSLGINIHISEKRSINFVHYSEFTRVFLSLSSMILVLLWSRKSSSIGTMFKALGYLIEKVR